MIIGILGYIGSGKGTVASYLANEYGFRQDSFAGSLKDACAALFDWPRHLLEGDTRESREWREQPDIWWSEQLARPGFSPRLALQLMGTDVIRNNFDERMWFLTVQNKIRKDPSRNVVISDVRFPNEVKFIKDQGGKLLKVNRGSQPVWVEIAIQANNGSSLAKDIMHKTYPNVHFSEWAWAGVQPDLEISNDGTLEQLYEQIREMMSKAS